MCTCAAYTSLGYYSRVGTIWERLLFEGGDYSRVGTIWERLLFKGGYYLRVGTIWERLLFEGDYYLKVATIWGWLLFEGGYYLRVASIEGWPLLRVTTIGGWLLFEGGIYWRNTVYRNLIVYFDCLHCWLQHCLVLCPFSPELFMSVVQGHCPTPAWKTLAVSCNMYYL